MEHRIERLEQWSLVRYAFSVAIGLLVTLLLFLLMEKLIESDRSPYSEPLKGELLSFVRLLEEPDPVTRVDPVKPPDPEPEPERVPDERLDPIICGSADCLWVVVDPPTDDPLGPTHNRFRTDRAATDAALKFKYKPKVLNGEGMDVQGVRNLIRFELEHG